MGQRIEHWLIEKLIPYARNPRTHSDAQIAQIAASIAEFGFNNPILVDTTPASSLATAASSLRERLLRICSTHWPDSFNAFFSVWTNNRVGLCEVPARARGGLARGHSAKPRSLGLIRHTSFTVLSGSTVEA